MCGCMCGCGNLTAREGVVKIALLSVDAESRHLVCLRSVSPAHRGKGPAEHAASICVTRSLEGGRETRRRCDTGRAPDSPGTKEGGAGKLLRCRNNCCAYVAKGGCCGYHRAPAVAGEIVGIAVTFGRVGVWYTRLGRHATSGLTHALSIHPSSQQQQRDAQQETDAHNRCAYVRVAYLGARTHFRFVGVLL